ncbi:gamma-glutamyl-gamma-aminobutyrate hydrolase family protein [Nitrosopumilus ureiphilus]|uniref:Peptidase C26 n=1 Tax=Nitrosopumilus ureiphilus TaxID=1470067 RepID=A0A7D5RC80_9ARCH|nr:gamma-glutamyl-gamma-aminobutyrate hydrolase family protein [Nitrosopumilus ureiphilus]QLH05741.1 peptidase C26 [Nitrosopumilus ureiphilus]
MSFKKIGISLRIVKDPNYGEKRDAISHDWPRLFEKLDMVPIFIPNVLSNVELFLDQHELNGIILSGGDDLGCDIERDRTEEDLLKYGIKNHLPVLGVCRGMQLINNYFGGKNIKTDNKKHVNSDHVVNIVQNSYSKNLGKKISVNSYHNNIIAVENIGEKLEPFAKSDIDDTIEGLIHTEYDITGVMWHPERDLNKTNQLLLKKIFSNGQ